MTVRYTTGTIAVSQSYLARDDDLSVFEARINMASELSARADGRHVEIEYQPYRVNASPNVPVVDPLTAIAWRVAKGVFERRFTSRFKEAFRAGLEDRINERIREKEFAADLLRDAYVRPGEFGLGFCVPINVLSELLDDEET